MGSPRGARLGVPLGRGLGDLARTAGAAPSPPLGTGRFAHWWVRSQVKCPQFRDHATPSPPPPGLRGYVSLVPTFSERSTSGSSDLRVQPFCNEAPVGRPPRPPGRAREKHRPVEIGGGIPRGGAPAAMPYLRGSCREARRGSARIPGLIVLPLSPYPSIQLGLLPLASS